LDELLSGITGKNMKNFLLIHIPLFTVAALIFFRCRSDKISPNTNLLVKVYQAMLQQKETDDFISI
jgi:hypothetical protein